MSEPRTVREPLRALLIAVDGEIRQAERVLAHATRVCYQRGCRCLPCRTANAAYSQQRRAAEARGLVPLGARVPAGPTRRRLASLYVEGYSRGDVARLLGLHPSALVPHHDRVTRRTARRVYRLWQRACGVDDGEA